ncbi:related to 3-hydroxyacyl-CoA dehydrogenase [Fusarium mangiferae]|uniref:Related to 3-hydroxyacyl-CoA dehydrogenase n=1 Tax=Fusarium mangiferae TaxID=192010 RepID=A0A1L7TD50_FUSMA|nr:uncharacterized protein FMAN_10960 [Fusarium mangiferae]CVK96630.1 related to 3-hydroxyacyl-CoA dehydrogenase [Fusarium mangiferae]
MAEYLLRDEDLQDLRGKVIIVTGGATGIGRALVQLAHDHGAKVAACDVNIEAGEELEQQLPTDFLFKKCDVSIWKDVIEFFQETYQRFGTIDTVISNAAINKVENLDDLDATDITDGEELREPDLSVLKVNMIGTWYVTRCAIHFFRKHPETRSQLVLFGSVASYFDTPPLYTYCASKAGVLGLFRALRTQTVKYNISVNMIAPWMTLTDMVTDHVKKVWGDLPANTPLDVAKASLLCVVRPEINGKAFLINGGKFTEVEDKLDETQAVWLGSELDKNMREGQRRLID